MNRIERYLEPTPDEPPDGSFYIVSVEFGYYYVTDEVARFIQTVLDRWVVPRWIVFHDRVGSRIRMRTRDIEAIEESTVEQRAADRLFVRARKDEEKADRNWDDD